MPWDFSLAAGRGLPARLIDTTQSCVQNNAARSENKAASGRFRYDFAVVRSLSDARDCGI